MGRSRVAGGAVVYIGASRQRRMFAPISGLLPLGRRDLTRDLFTSRYLTLSVYLQVSHA
jgi:hypothetical protein